MPVQLSDDGRAVAWGDSVQGDEIPTPPTENPPYQYRWDGSDWVHDPLQPEAWYDRPGVVDRETRDLIGEKVVAKGNSALSNLNQIENNPNVPDEVTQYLQDIFAIQYLGYVGLTGNRIQSVEQRFFNE